MKKNITIKSNINKIVKIHNLQQYTSLIINYFFNLSLLLDFQTKNPL